MSDRAGEDVSDRDVQTELAAALRLALDELRRLVPNTNPARIAARKALTLHEEAVLRRAYSLTPSELVEWRASHD